MYKKTTKGQGRADINKSVRYGACIYIDTNLDSSSISSYDLSNWPTSMGSFLMEIDESKVQKCQKFVEFMQIGVVPIVSNSN